MPETFATARQEFIRQMYRDNTVSERPRLVAVLDAVIAWSNAHSEQLRFRPGDSSKGAIRFEDTVSSTVILMISPRRANSPLLQVLPGSSRLLSEDERTDIVMRLNSHTREENPFGRMHIGFGALKNPAGRAAVFALLDEVLEKVRPAVPSAKVS